MLILAAPGAVEVAVGGTAILTFVSALVAAGSRWLVAPLLRETRQLAQLRGRLENTLGAVHAGVDAMGRIQRSQEDRVTALEVALDAFDQTLKIEGQWRHQHDLVHESVDRRLAQLDRREAS